MDVENSEGVCAIGSLDRQNLRAWPLDVERLVDDQLAGDQTDSASDAKGDRRPSRRAGDNGAQRSGPSVTI